MHSGIMCYEGSQEEWNDFIDYDNVSMFVFNSQKFFDFNKNATVKGIVSGCYYDNGYVKANVKMEYAFEDSVAILAVYDKDGRMVAMGSKPLTTFDTDTSFALEVKEECIGMEVKTFFWKGLNTLKPIGNVAYGVVVNK